MMLVLFFFVLLHWSMMVSAASPKTFHLLAIRRDSLFMERYNLEANLGSFWYGKAPSTFCPRNSTPQYCNANYDSQSTRFKIDRLNNPGVTKLYTEVGNQTVYADENGLLTYTRIHTPTIPDGALTRNLVVNTQGRKAQVDDYGVLYFLDSNGVLQNSFKLCRKDIPTIPEYRLYVPGNTGGGEDICVNVNVVVVSEDRPQPKAYGFY